MRSDGEHDDGERVSRDGQTVVSRAEVAQQINVGGDAHFHPAATAWSSRSRVVVALLALAGLAIFTWLASAPDPAESQPAGGLTIRADGCGSTGVGGSVDAEVNGLDVSATRGGQAIQGDLKVRRTGTSSDTPGAEDNKTGQTP